MSSQQQSSCFYLEKVQRRSEYFKYDQINIHLFSMGCVKKDVYVQYSPFPLKCTSSQGKGACVSF